MDIYSNNCKKAFKLYLRTGIPIGLSLKYFQEEDENKDPVYYIWQTSRDSDVRPTHAANHGKIFDEESPPATGNPGHEPNCRCTAIYIDKNDPRALAMTRAKDTFKVIAEHEGDGFVYF